LTSPHVHGLAVSTTNGGTILLRAKNHQDEAQISPDLTYEEVH
jgi:hypothetical protein